MGWNSCLLLGDPALLARLFPGWKPPLRPPVRRREVNPFTRERVSTLNEVADYDDGEKVPMVCDWKRLGALDPSRVGQTFEPEDLDRLAKVLRVRGKAYRRALSEPPGCTTVVLELMEPFVKALRALTPEQVRDAEGAWAQDATEEDLAQTVASVQRMATEATARKLFLYLVNQV